MANLSNEHRLRIARSIVAHRYGKAIELARVAMIDAGDKLYEALYTPAQQAMMNALPDGYLDEDCVLSIHFKVGNHNYWESALLSSSRRIANVHRHGRLTAKENPEVALSLERCKEVHLAHKELLDRKQKDLDAVYTQLKQYRTFKQLREMWPETEAFIPPEPAPSRALTKPPAELNARLGLPPEGVVNANHQ